MGLHIVSGFLGAGKTTFLNRYLPLLSGKTVVIENEAGDIGIDGTLLQGDFLVRELSAGCICCTLAGELHKELALITHRFKPDQIVMEPSGIGALTDIVKHCESAGVEVERKIVLVDTSAYWNYKSGFGFFYLDQISKADALLLSHVGDSSVEEQRAVIDDMRAYNKRAVAYCGDWRDLDDDELMAFIESADSIDHGTLDGTGAEASLPAKEKDFSKTLLKGLAPLKSDDVEKLAAELQSDALGTILRVKGFFTDEQGRRSYFGFTPTGYEYRAAEAGEDFSEDCAVVIGCDLKIPELRTLFGAKLSL